MNPYDQMMGQIPTLEQHNFQRGMESKMKRLPAGVRCTCGTEMVFSEVDPLYNISSGNPNCLSPMKKQNVACPACGKTGHKA